MGTAGIDIEDLSGIQVVYETLFCCAGGDRFICGLIKIKIYVVVIFEIERRGKRLWRNLRDLYMGTESMGNY